MSFFTVSRDLPIASAIPADVSNDSVLQKLHDHKFLVRLSPTVISCEPTEVQDKTILEKESSYSGWCKITEKVPVVGTISFIAGFKDQPDGLDSVVYAQAGLVMHLSTRVVDDDGGQQGKRMLKEENNLSGNGLLMPFIVSQVKSIHPKNHIRLFESIRKSSDNQGV